MTKKQIREVAKRYRRTATSSTPKHEGHGDTGLKPRPKRAVNVSIDAEILKVAKEMDINLSGALEEALRKLTEDERVRRWQEANREATASYNAYIAQNGVLGEELLDLDDPTV